MVNVVDLIVSRSGRVIKLPRLDLRMTPDTNNSTASGNNQVDHIDHTDLRICQRLKRL
jgi:hypothetical protein